MWDETEKRTIIETLLAINELLIKIAYGSDGNGGGKGSGSDGTPRGGLRPAEPPKAPWDDDDDDDD